jgi:GT2 family glycosyltransferase
LVLGGVAAGDADARVARLRESARRAGVILEESPTPLDAEARRRFAAELSAADILCFAGVDAWDRIPDLEGLTSAVASRCRTGQIALCGELPQNAEAARAAGVPVLSVVVPVHDAAASLPPLLASLEASAFPRASWELVVVDDASSDESAALAAAHCDVLIRLTGTPRGPSYARNRGAEVARGAYLLFLDADVVVEPETLERTVARLEADPGLAAVTGVYGHVTPARTLASSYRTAFDHFQQVRSAGEVDSFFGACGAVRRSAFLDAGMYDEWRFARPQIEDVELGHRLREAGHRIVLDPGISVTHGRRWTVGSLLRDEFVHRTVPGVRVLGPRWNVFRAPTLRGAKWQYSTMLASVVVAAFLVMQLVLGGVWWLGAVPATGVMLALEWPLLATFARLRGIAFVVVAAPLHLLITATNGVAYAWGGVLRSVFGEPRPAPLLEAWAEVQLEAWPPMPRKPLPIRFPAPRTEP